MTASLKRAHAELPGYCLRVTIVSGRRVEVWRGTMTRELTEESECPALVTALRQLLSADERRPRRSFRLVGPAGGQHDHALHFQILRTSAEILPGLDSRHSLRRHRHRRFDSPRLRISEPEEAGEDAVEAAVDVSTPVERLLEASDCLIRLPSLLVHSAETAVRPGPISIVSLLLRDLDGVGGDPHGLLESGAWRPAAPQGRAARGRRAGGLGRSGGGAWGKRGFGTPIRVVLLVWTDGQIRIPVSYRVWHKGGPSKYTLALELLSYARNRLQCKPQWVLFDAWYPSKALLKRLRDYGWYFVCQLKKNRRFDGKPLHRYLQQPYWQAVGFLTGDMKVLVVKYRRKYYATNRLSLPAKEVRQHYKIRHAVEEVIRTVKSQLGLEAGKRATGAAEPRQPVQCIGIPKGIFARPHAGAGGHRCSGRGQWRHSGQRSECWDE